MKLKWREMAAKESAGLKKAARKVYSAVALSTRARLKLRKGTSR